MSGERRFLAALLAVTWGAFAVRAAGSENQHPVAPECVQAPTAACVLSAAIETAKAIDDAAERASALVGIADVQRTVGDEKGAQESLAHARAASAKVEIPSITLAWPDTLGKDDLAKADTIVDISEAQISAGALQDAAQTMLKARGIFARLNDTGEVGILSDDLRHVAGLQARAGDFEGALVTADLIGNGTSLKRAMALADIAHAQAAAGDPVGALAVQRQVEDAYFRIIVLADVGLALAASGDLTGAAAAAVRIAEISEQATRYPVYIEAEIMRSAIFRAIAEAHIADGALEKAAATLEKIERAYAYVDAAMAVATAQMAAGEFDDARMTADRICWTRHRNDRCTEALANLALAHAQAGDIRKAWELVSLAWEKVEWSMTALELFRAYVSLSRAQTKMCDAEGGRKAFAEALTAGNDIDYLPDRVENLAALGETAALQLGQLDGANQAFSAAMAAAGENEDSWPGLMEDIRRRRVSALFGAGEARARERDLSGAREAFSLALIGVQAVDDKPWRARLFRDIASALNSIRDGTLSGDKDR